MPGIDNAQYERLLCSDNLWVLWPDLNMDSRARFVRWSDGSLQLLIGDEVLNVSEVDAASDHGYLYSRPKQAALLEVAPLFQLLLNKHCSPAQLAILMTPFLGSQMSLCLLCSVRGSSGRRWYSGQLTWILSTTSA